MSSAKKKNFKKDLNYLVYITIAIFVLLLSIANMQNMNKHKTIKVLGAKTNTVFWEDFIKKHPDYIDGLIELGKLNEVKRIDPNYFR